MKGSGSVFSDAFLHCGGLGGVHYNIDIAGFPHRLCRAEGVIDRDVCSTNWVKDGGGIEMRYSKTKTYNLLSVAS